jgi:hypothetical protein
VTSTAFRSIGVNYLGILSVAWVESQLDLRSPYLEFIGSLQAVPADVSACIANKEAVFFNSALDIRDLLQEPL